MPAKRPGRDPRYTRTMGETPHVGRRYVENDKVRIEWTEGGKRRTRTIGPNDPANRARADDELEDILTRLGDTMTAKPPVPTSTALPESVPADSEPPAKAAPLADVVDALRNIAVSLMDTADELADWLQKQFRAERSEGAEAEDE